MGFSLYFFTISLFFTAKGFTLARQKSYTDYGIVYNSLLERFTFFEAYINLKKSFVIFFLWNVTNIWHVLSVGEAVFLWKILSSRCGQNQQKTHVMESDFYCNETHVRLITIKIALHHVCFLLIVSTRYEGMLCGIGISISFLFFSYILSKCHYD